MATATGGDVILQLMTDVAELKAGQDSMTEHLEKMSAHLGEVVSISKAQGIRLGRTVELLTRMATKLQEHEERLSKLEARAQ